MSSPAKLEGWKDRDVSAWFIFAHLNWDGHKLSQNYGFDVAQRIRMEFGSPAPIIFYSPIKEAYFLQLSDVKYKLLNGCGTAFLETPTSNETFQRLYESTDPLSKTALLDVVTMLCNVRGWVVDRLNHDLKPGRKCGPVFDAVEPLLSSAQKQQMKFEEYRDRFAELDARRNKKAFMDLRAEFIRACDALLPNELKRKAFVSAPEEEPERPHVLLLEDDPTYRSSIVDALSGEFNVHPAESSKEAMSILEDDLDRNEILAVICDWRLYEYTNEAENRKTERWQCPQGYSVLEYAASKGIRALYALTSQDDQLVHAMRNLSGIRYSLFKKEHLQTPAQLQVFLDVLHGGCEEAMMGIANKIKGAPWEKHLRTLYVALWNSIDYHAKLREWNDRATDAWNYYLDQARDSRQPITAEKKDITLSPNSFDLDKFMIMRRVMLAVWSKTKRPFDQGDITYNKEFVFDAIWSSANVDSEKKSISVNARFSQYCLGDKYRGKAHLLPEEIQWLQAHDIPLG